MKWKRVLWCFRWIFANRFVEINTKVDCRWFFPSWKKNLIGDSFEMKQWWLNLLEKCFFYSHWTLIDRSMKITKIWNPLRDSISETFFSYVEFLFLFNFSHSIHQDWRRHRTRIETEYKMFLSSRAGWESKARLLLFQAAVRMQRWKRVFRSNGKQRTGAKMACFRPKKLRPETSIFGISIKFWV